DPSSGGLTVRIATQAGGGQERRPPAGGHGSRIGALARGCHVVPFIRGVVAGCLALGLVGCATSSDGTRERTGLARFDASSVSSPTASYSLQSDGTWAGMRGDRYMVKNDEIQAVAPFATSRPIVGGSTKIFIDRDDNGLHF